MTPIVLVLAALVPNPDGAVYDSANNINWLANANLPASNRFGLPLCSAAGAQQTCVNAAGSMNYTSAAAWVAAMNAAGHLGHTDWQLPTTPLNDNTCPLVGPNGGSFGMNCRASAFGSLFYDALGLKEAATAVPIPNNTAGPFSNFQPYLYWSQSVVTGGYGAFSFNTGWTGANTIPHVMYVLPMIPGKISPAPSGTVYDSVANVTWLANANLAATNTFGLPACDGPGATKICVNPDGAMSRDSALQFIANMNNAAYLGQKNWELPPLDPNCGGFNCSSPQNSMGELFYGQLGLTRGMPVVPTPNTPVGPFHNIQPYLYWSCQAATIQSPCSSDVPSPNFEWSFSFGNGFQGTDLLANDLYVTAYYVGPPPGSPPALTSGSVANGATYIAGGLVPGSWAQVKGTNLATTTHIGWTDADLAGLGSNLPANLNGTEVKVDGISAPVYSITSGQVDFQVPAGVSGNASIQVFTNGIRSNVLMASAANNAPGIFPCAVSGINYPCAYFPDGEYVWQRNAKPGDVVQMFGTGLMPSPAGVRVSVTPVSGVTVTLGTITVPAQAALVYPGEFQVNFTVPNVPDGNYPLTIAVNGVQSPAMINSSPPGAIVLPVQN